ncbi:flagellin [Pseudomonas sp. LS-2]|jgi:flagellin|uniref:flagellin N-terminal helical domain-containing protein n=1 Tax=Pseudomonas sp. LS-2 TaxID=2315859 RepID=UPI000E74B8D5|nr:flagellin [Pseudomonas sp. LS-2]RJX80616.1 flagellin [Pseudomonas sp. LS-2]
MALTVHTNNASLSVQRNLNRSSDALSLSMSRLSSGLRINSAKDDAAGLQVANRLTMQVRGLTVAAQNANDGISIAQTAEGAMKEMTNILMRMRDLGLQAKNGNYDAKSRDAMNQEFQQMSQELTRISKDTKFGSGLRLLDGSAGTLTFHVGANTGPSEEISLTLDRDMSTESLLKPTTAIAAEPAVAGQTTGSKGVNAGEYTPLAIDGTGHRNTSTTFTADTALTDAVTTKQGELQTAKDAFTQSTATDEATLAPLREAVAKASQELAAAENAVTEDIKIQRALNNKAMGDNIDNVINVLSHAIGLIDEATAELGAKQNRLAATVSNISNVIQNVSVSRGRILDVDFAAETAEMTKQQTLQQASTAILAQANQLPAAVLKLLQ